MYHPVQFWISESSLVVDVLYSPWRLQYILSKKRKECIFCIPEIARNAKEHFVTYVSEHSFVILNLYPYNNGHLMVVPKRHVPNLSDLPETEITDLFKLVQMTERVLKKVYSPEGINIGLNLGRCAGAGIDDHLHVHILPRWTGDSNFMTSVSGTRVIPENFEVTYEKVREAFKNESTRQ